MDGSNVHFNIRLIILVDYNINNRVKNWGLGEGGIREEHKGGTVRKNKKTTIYDQGLVRVLASTCFFFKFQLTKLI